MHTLPLLLCLVSELPIIFSFLLYREHWVSSCIAAQQEAPYLIPLLSGLTCTLWFIKPRYVCRLSAHQCVALCLNVINLDL